MNNYELTIKDIKKHPSKWEKELYHFIYNNRHTRYQMDLYYYPHTKEFYEFTNVGGNSWLSGNDYVCVYSVNNEHSDEWQKGSIRDTAIYYHEHIEEILENILLDLKERFKWEIEGTEPF